MILRSATHHRLRYPSDSLRSSETSDELMLIDPLPLATRYSDYLTACVNFELVRAGCLLARSFKRSNSAHDREISPSSGLNPTGYIRRRCRSREASPKATLKGVDSCSLNSGPFDLVRVAIGSHKRYLSIDTICSPVLSSRDGASRLRDPRFFLSHPVTFAPLSLATTAVDSLKRTAPHAMDPPAPVHASPAPSSPPQEAETPASSTSSTPHTTCPTPSSSRPTPTKRVSFCPLAYMIEGVAACSQEWKGKAVNAPGRPRLCSRSYS
jgi:hypothetical protein